MQPVCSRRSSTASARSAEWTWTCPPARSRLVAPTSRHAFSDQVLPVDVTAQSAIRMLSVGLAGPEYVVDFRTIGEGARSEEPRCALDDLEVGCRAGPGPLES